MGRTKGLSVQEFLDNTESTGDLLGALEALADREASRLPLADPEGYKVLPGSKVSTDLPGLLGLQQIARADAEAQAHRDADGLQSTWTALYDRVLEERQEAHWQQMIRSQHQAEEQRAQRAAAAKEIDDVQENKENPNGPMVIGTAISTLFLLGALGAYCLGGPMAAVDSAVSPEAPEAQELTEVPEFAEVWPKTW
ncbi:MAG: hypothetical protein AAF766_18500 [Cyanobacteria bacterium P01_D01_bin.14]